MRSTADVARVSTHEAFSAKEVGSASLYVGFLKERPGSAAVKTTLALQTDIDQLRVHEREVYWLARNNIAESTISMAALEKALQTPPRSGT